MGALNSSIVTVTEAIMAHESSVRAGSGISVFREGLAPGHVTDTPLIPGMRGTNLVLINYEDVQSKAGVIQTSGLTVTTDAVHVTGPENRLRGRRQLQIQNLGSPNGVGTSEVYIGASASVTSSTGFQIPSGVTKTLDVLDVGNIFIVSADTSDVRILELK